MRGGAGLMVATVAAWLLAGGARAQAPPQPVHDATQEFNLSSNPNGVWSYRVEQLQGLRLMNETDQAFRNVAGLDAWTFGKQDSTRAFVASNTTENAVHSGEVRFPKGELVLKSSQTDSVFVFFKAPEHGLYRVSGFFEGVDKKAQNHMVQIAGRKTIYFRTDIVEYGQRAQFHFFLSMKKGDVLNFASASTGGQRSQRGATGLKLLVKGPEIK